jgi:5'-3' exonuclease
MNSNTIFKQTPTTALIDGDHIAFIIAVNKKQTEEQVEEYGKQEDRTLEDCIKELDNYYDKLLSDLQGKVPSLQYYLGFISKGSFRKEQYPDYKANRTSEPPVHLKELKKYLVYNKGFKYEYGLEADDLQSIYQSKSEYGSTVIVSNDKDMKQVPGLHMNFKDLNLIEISSDDAYNNLCKQIAIGDSIDNIKKPFRFGEAGFQKLSINADLKGENLFTEVLNLYMLHMGTKDGLNLFTKNFNLVYLLKDSQSYNKNLLTQYKINNKTQEDIEGLIGLA